MDKTKYIRAQIGKCKSAQFLFLIHKRKTHGYSIHKERRTIAKGNATSLHSFFSVSPEKSITQQFHTLPFLSDFFS